MIALRESVTIPAYLIEELKDKPYSKLGAYIDILNMADENGEFYSTTRKLMSRWGWGSGKTTSFIKELEKRNIIRTQNGAEAERKRNTLFVLNSEFLGFFNNGNGTQTERKRNGNWNGNNGEIVDNLQVILNVWNELSSCGIEPIPEIGISNVQYRNLKGMAEKYGVDDVVNTIQRIKISDFLQGKVSEWKITFNWFLKDGNYQKVRSGKYDGGNGISRQVERSGSSEQAEDEELIGDEWVDL